MNITPFLSRLFSSAVNRGYSVNINDGIIRIKISDNERLIITQFLNGDIHCGLSKYGIVSTIPKNMVFDFLFSVDEYGLRIHDDLKDFSL
ncbi:hypothetical protein DOJ20_21080 [Salmonella enterica subsp. enterica serovar Javiana]|nr:hypothetical protein [Salmonella enterica subsp. enterica serovar Javiana]